MIINLTTPMSDDKERERHTKAVLDAIEQYTEKRMNDDQPTHHNAVAAAAPADRIGGGGGLPCGVVGVATQSDADLLEEMRFTYETVCSEGYNDTDYTEALDFEIEARGWEAAFAVAVAKLRQPTQSDALRDQLLQECLVKLRDVQGTEAPKQYACNLIKRIERVLQGQSK